MKIWMSEPPIKAWRSGVIYFQSPNWWEGPDGYPAEWAGFHVYPGLSFVRSFHKALTGEPLPPWPLLSEIEISDKPTKALKTDHCRYADSYSVGAAGAYTSCDTPYWVWGCKFTRQIRVWCPGECEVPKGWEEE